MLPFLDVACLAPSSSFYAAVTQPLGLTYLSATTTDNGRPSLVFGECSKPLFELREAADFLRRSRLAISAASPAAVHDFYNCATRAGARVATVFSEDQPSDDSPSPVRASATDHDGNTMEVVYVPPPSYGSRYGGSTVRRTQSSSDEVSRIMSWNYDVAATSGPAHHGPARYSEEPMTLVHRSVTTTRATPALPPPPSPREGSRGLSAAGVASLIAVGAAAGAAFTYTVLKHDRARAPSQEFEAPSFRRRSTFPDPYPGVRPQAIEVERTVEKIRYPPAEYPAVADHRRPAAPTHIARYSLAGAQRDRVREVGDDAYDERQSRHSSRYRIEPPPSHRSRSAAPAESRRAPLMLTEGEHRSVVSSKHSAMPSSRSIRRSATYDVGDHETYVSARSRRSSSTIRPPPPLEKSSQSRHPPRSSAGRTVSYASARRIPLPASGTGSSHAEWDDDMVSVAPSDSISCVGSRRSGRAYR
jgi:hypothetical protein